MVTKTYWQSRFFRFIGRILAAIWFVIACLFSLWALLAFWFQLPFGKAGFFVVAVLWVILTIIGLFYDRKKPWRGRAILPVMFIGVGIWWSSIKPTLDRDWAPELARMVTAEFDRHDRNIVRIRNIRDFDWITPDRAKPAWKDETYNIDDICALDVYLSYWMGPYIAHTLVGFTFKDGRHLVFSAEIRRTKEQNFSAIGGFFKEFELIIIAAPEEDIIKLRTDIRRENVYRYSIRVGQDKMRALFVDYLENANELAHKARFYNTLTTNCTTVVFNMARILYPGLPPDWRIIFSGQLPSYLYKLKLIETQKSLATIVDEAHIAPQNNGIRSRYSVEIRRPTRFNGN
ncbi:DUF4105 domain-containing protein [uncultured Bartonella sp.]|uniref:Lnb N-terminal periplasmic domain-containing protein n=1 Tax=uncultured Bartonella sp. TaxID=104108 RepID=UPI0026146E5A|nr:DUF4105 domain-containing protein [uncultured Bartonella sp.]